MVPHWPPSLLPLSRVFVSPNRQLITAGPSLHNYQPGRIKTILQRSVKRRLLRSETGKSLSKRAKMSAFGQQQPASVWSINIVVAGEALVRHSDNTKMVIFGDQGKIGIMPCHQLWSLLTWLIPEAWGQMTRDKWPPSSSCHKDGVSRNKILSSGSRNVTCYACVFKCLNICSDFNVVWGMWPGQGAHAAHRMSVPWPLSVGVIAIIIITFSQFPPSPHSQPVIT